MLLLDEAKAVDDFVQVEVGVLPWLHGGLLSLKLGRAIFSMNGLNGA